MLKIALCIKKTKLASVMENMILRYQKESNILLTVDVFSDVRELEHSIRADYMYDLFVLEFKEVSKKLPKIRKWIELYNDKAELVLVSSEIIELENWFEIRPMDILIYPFTYERLTKMLYTVRDEGSKDKYFHFSYKRRKYRIPLDEILYFESADRKINIITKGNQYIFYGKLQEIADKLSHEDFIYVHKSYIVNGKYIQEYSYREITMVNFEKIPISQKNRKRVRIYEVRTEKDEF